MTSLDSSTAQANYPTTTTLPSGEAQPLSDTAPKTSGFVTDGERECAIALAGSMVEHHMGEWQAHGCFTDRAAADVARLRMEALIKGRSAEQVRRLEIARGLV
jgi:hypothetical protein